MLDLSEILTKSMGEISISHVIVTMVITIILGLMIGYTYKLTTDVVNYAQAFFHTLLMLPTLIALIVMLIGSNVMSAFSLAGVFSIIRFRSIQTGPKDISFILFTAAVGLACGGNCDLYAAVFTVIFCIVILVFRAAKLGVPKKNVYLLKITIPENLNFKGIFDEILDEYSSNYSLTKIKTADMGSVFELSYDIELKDDMDTKEFIDKVRCKNGNLTVMLSLAAAGPQQ